MSTESLVASVAQIAHNHLSLRILPHVVGGCRCRSERTCKRNLLYAVRLATKVMHGYATAPRRPTIAPQGET